MGKRAGRGVLAGGLHRRETASRIEQKFARAGDSTTAQGTRRTRRQKTSERTLETEVVAPGLILSSAREGFEPALATFVAQLIRRGLEAGELQMLEGVVFAVDEIVQPGDTETGESF